MSSFRDFSRQLTIWNGKFSGETTDARRGRASPSSRALVREERIDTILLWSALPGASRHHWGTDVDLVDRARDRAGLPGTADAAGVRAGWAVSPGSPSGWTTHAARFGFFRPFRGVMSGVAARTLAFQLCAHRRECPPDA